MAQQQQLAMAPAKKNIELVWRDGCRRQLPMYDADFIRGTQQKLWCHVVTLSPRIRLPWQYTSDQVDEGDVWECGAVWLHVANLPNGQVYTHSVFEELTEALNILHANVDAARYRLLISPDGMNYDVNRLGGDHQITISNGRHFTLSVRKHASTKVLLAIAW
jgi:hypothetical protein